MTEKGIATGSRLKMIAAVSGLALAATPLVGAAAPSAGVSPAAIAAPAPPAPPEAPTPPAPAERRSGKRAWLGIVISGGEEEVTIASVSDGSPADEAGLREGDRILEIDDEEVADADDVMRAVRSHAPGDKLRIRVERDGQNKTFTATLEGRAARDPRAFEWTPEPGEHPQIFSFGSSRVFLGVEMHPMSGDLREHFRAPRDAGLLINRVIEDTAAERAGLKAGDVIIEVNGDTVSDVGDITRALREKEPGDQVTVRIVRDGSEQSLDVKLGERRGHGVPRGMIFAPDGDEVRAWALSAEDREELERSMQDVRREIEESMRELRESMREYRDDQQEIRRDVREKLRGRVERDRVIRVVRGVSYDI